MTSGRWGRGAEGEREGGVRGGHNLVARRGKAGFPMIGKSFRGADGQRMGCQTGQRRTREAGGMYQAEARRCSRKARKSGV